MPAPRDWIESAALTDSVRALARRGTLCRFAKGAVLIQEGAPSDLTMYIVLDGLLRAYGSTLASERELVYGEYRAGEYVGEMGLDGGPRSASVIAVEPTVCSRLTRQTVQQHVHDDPAFAFELLLVVIQRARTATETAKDLALTDVYGRLRRHLERAAVPDGDGRRRIAERPTHKELANRLGCSREMVTRLLKDLQHGGYIEAGRAGIVILKPLPAGW